MENKINNSDQNTGQVGQNPSNQAMHVPEKPKLNIWNILIFILSILLLLTMSIIFLDLRKANVPISSPTPSVSPTKPVSKASFIGTVKTGAQLGEIKSYCSDGLYIVSDEGTYVVNQTTILQLRVPIQPNGTKMFSDQKYIDKKVEVVGKYPAQEFFCEALICECEDYILVDSIDSITSDSSP